MNIIARLNLHRNRMKLKYEVKIFVIQLMTQAFLEKKNYACFGVKCLRCKKFLKCNHQCALMVRKQLKICTQPTTKQPVDEQSRKWLFKSIGFFI